MGLGKKTKEIKSGSVAEDQLSLLEYIFYVTSWDISTIEMGPSNCRFPIISMLFTRKDGTETGGGAVIYQHIFHYG